MSVSTHDDLARGRLPAFATIRTWTQLSGFSRTRTYKLLGTGHLRAKKCGKLTLIDVPYGLAFIQSLPPAKIRVRS